MNWSVKTRLAVIYTLFVISISAWFWYQFVPRPAEPDAAEIEAGMKYSPLPEILMPRMEAELREQASRAETAGAANSTDTL